MMTSDQGEKTLQNHDTSSAKIIKGNEDDRIQHLPFTAGPYGDISCMDVVSETYPFVNHKPLILAQ